MSHREHYIKGGGVFICRLHSFPTNKILLVNLSTIFNTFAYRTRFSNNFFPFYPGFADESLKTGKCRTTHRSVRSCPSLAVTNEIWNTHWFRKASFRDDSEAGHMITRTFSAIVICVRHAATFGGVIGWFIDESAKRFTLGLFLVRQCKRDVVLQFSSEFGNNCGWDDLRDQFCFSWCSFRLTGMKKLDTISD